MLASKPPLDVTRIQAGADAVESCASGGPCLPPVGVFPPQVCPEFSPGSPRLPRSSAAPEKCLKPGSIRCSSPCSGAIERQVRRR